MAKLYNLARMTTATTGTGTITLGSAVTGCLSFANAGVQDGDIISYSIIDGSNSEVGRGVYTASGTTLTRLVLKSTNSDSAISLSGDAEVFITALAEDIFEHTLYLDVGPASPHAKDDEFSGTSLNGKWTNPATSTRTNTISISNGFLRLEPGEGGTGSTSSRGGYGIRQVAPTGSFSISAKVCNTGHISPQVRVGVFVARTTSSVAHINGSAVGLSRYINVDDLTYSESADWGAYAGYDSFTSGLWPMLSWYKITWNSGEGSLSFYYSLNGLEWTLQATRTGQEQPDRIGLAIWSSNQDIYADQAMYVEWFRVTEP